MGKWCKVFLVVCIIDYLVVVSIVLVLWLLFVVYVVYSYSILVEVLDCEVVFWVDFYI